MFLAQGALALNVVLMLVPVALAQFALLLPGAFVPDELQIVGKLLPQPLVGTVGTIHPHAVLHILIGDGIEAELADEAFQGFWRPCLFDAPDGLSQGVRTSPGSDVDGTGIIFVSQTDEEFTAWRVVAFADDLDAATLTTHHSTAFEIVGTGPVA